MSEMNSVSNLLAAWVKFALNGKHIYTSNGDRNGLLGKAVCEDLFFFGSVFSKWTFYRHRAEVPYHHAP